MKKVLSILLALLLLMPLGVGLVSVPTAAAASSQKTDVEQLVMAGYERAAIPEDAVAIDSRTAFSSMNANGTYYLTADITVVSSYTTTFKGKLYGNGHTITVSGDKPVFSTLDGATVCDLTVKGAVSMSADNVGGLAAAAYNATLTGITNEASIHNSKFGKFSGGIVGYAENTTLSYCTNKGAITGNSSETRPGGLVGQMDNAEATLTLKHCINYGAVTGINQTGGLVSRVQNGSAVYFEYCANFGTVTVGSTDSGGIIGKVTAATTEVKFEHCYNSGRINGGTIVGGMVGPVAAHKLTLTDCHNGCFVKNCACGGSDHGRLTNHTGSHAIGGLIGNSWLIDLDFTMTDCSNSGDVVAGESGIRNDSSDANTLKINSRVGGLVGVMTCGRLVAKNCHNSGAVKSDYYLGGLFGRLDATGADSMLGTILLENCSNEGELTTKSYGGGIIGYQNKAEDITMINCHNRGKITTGWNAGGLLARTDNSRTLCTMSFIECSNSGEIKANGTAGGIVGILTGTYDLIKELTFTDCTNSGSITTPNYAGGMAGIADVKKTTVTNCRNTGDMNIVDQNEGGYAGGIVGRAYGVCNFTNCFNSGNIIEKSTLKSGGSAYSLTAGGIAGGAGRAGSDYKSDHSVFKGCVNGGVVVDKSALNDKQSIKTGGIVGHAASTCYADRCVVVGEVNGTCQVAGIAASCGANGQGGSDFSSCIVNADIYNNGAKVTDRTHGAAGIACYIWGDAHLFSCVVMGDITLNVNGSDLLMYQRRPCSAMVGYTNNGGGEFHDNFFAGTLKGGEGTDCIVVMLAYTVDADVSGDEGGDITNNYSYNEYHLHYWGNRRESGELVGGVYSESKTPRLTEEQIAEGISFADMMVELDPTLEIVKTCTGIEVPILGSMRANYTWAMEHSTMHEYMQNCDPTCPTCGKAKVELVHVYSHDCDEKCNSCEAIREVPDHDWGPWVTVKPATEEETGLRKSMCQICGFYESQVVPVISVKNESSDSDQTEGANGAGATDPDAEQGIGDSKLVLIIGLAAGGAVLVAVVVIVCAVSAKKRKAKKQQAE